MKSIFLSGLLMASSSLLPFTVRGQTPFPLPNSVCQLFCKGAFTAAAHPALMALEETASLAFSGKMFYGLRELKQFGFCGILPYKHSAAGLRYEQSGNPSMRFSRITLNIAHRPSPSLSVGLGAERQSRTYTASEADAAYSLQASFFADLGRKLSTGLRVEGLFARQAVQGREQPPGHALLWGLSYRSDPKTLLQAEIEKKALQRAEWRAGLLYKPDSAYVLHAGVSGQFREFRTGISRRKRNLETGFALMVHAVLGISSQISLTYAFSR